MLIIKNVDTYAPEHLGKNDILIGGGKILSIDNEINFSHPSLTVIDGTNKIACPGFIDRHVHVTGGGGEGGVTTRAPEVKISDLIKGGITSVLGMLGTDATTRTIRDLIAKTKSINELGLNSLAITGSYQTPSPTMTGNVRDDMVFIAEITGAKIAISDHRSSRLTDDELIRLASDVYIGGKISGKKGLLVLHIGDGKSGLRKIKTALQESDLPMSVFHPTHINRNPALLKEGIAFLKDGGYIDLTCGMQKENRAGEIISELVKEGINTDKLTLSSDGNGSYSTYDKDGNLLSIGVASVLALYEEFTYMLSECNMPLSQALPFFTINPAEAIGLGTSKGKLSPGYDADILLLDQNAKISDVISRGQTMMKDSQITKMIPFE